MINIYIYIYICIYSWNMLEPPIFMLSIHVHTTIESAKCCGLIRNQPPMSALWPCESCEACWNPRPPGRAAPFSRFGHLQSIKLFNQLHLITKKSKSAGEAKGVKTSISDVSRQNDTFGDIAGRSSQEQQEH